MENEVVIRFPSLEPSEAALAVEGLAQELEHYRRSRTTKIESTIKRENPEAQDFGTTLILVLGAPAVVVAANAIRDYFRRREWGYAEINGNVISGIASKDVAEIVRAMSEKRSDDDRGK